MNFVLSLLVIVLTISCITARKEHSDHKKNPKWQTHAQKHGLKFNSEEEEVSAFANYEDNDDEIEAHNKAGNSFALGHNEFSHWNKKDQEKHMGSVQVEFEKVSKRGVPTGFSFSKFAGQNHTFQIYTATAGFVPKSSIDWVVAGFNTTVRNQLQCGDCWAFATTAAVEAAIWMKNKTNVVLSPQQLTSCSVSYGNNACNGGNVAYAYGYINDVGIVEDKYIPFTSGNGTNGTCTYNYITNIYPKYKVSKYYMVTRGDDNALIEALNLFGPLPVSIDASGKFGYYRSGIYANSTGICTNNTNHAVLLTGYGVESSSGQKYWTIKNQWGTSWGNRGYMNISRNLRNNCGISKQVFIPVL